MPVLRQGLRGECEGTLMGNSAAQPKAMPGDGASVFRLGTGSRRRQLLAGKVWENVICEEIRGNVDTRLRKLREGSYDGIILAKAGLDRLGTASDWEGAFDFYPISPKVFLPAACQGIIAVEAVEGSVAAGICKEISDAETELCYTVEREALALLSADCSEAAAAWCRRVSPDQGVCVSERAYSEDRICLDVMYADRWVDLTGIVNLEEGRKMARLAAQMVRNQTD